MPEDIISDYYIKKERKLLKDFKSRLILATNLLKEYLKQHNPENLIDQIIDEYKGYFPKIPYLGGFKSPLTQILVRCVSELAIFRVLERNGLSFREIGEFHYRFNLKHHKKRREALVQANKKPSQYPFESVYIEYQRKLTEETQARIYPDNWIMEFVEGQGNNFEWGWDIYQCGVQQAYKILKGEKYLPLICLGDFYEAEGLGYGFSRTESLGFGGKKCTHRFVKQSKAPKAWPPYDLEEFNKDFWSE